MKQGLGVLGCGLLGLVVMGCGSPDPEDKATADCGTVQQPLVLTLKDVQPAPGSSVANLDIVQSFTIVGKLLQLQPSFAASAAHTAGSAIPSPLTWTLALSGGNSVYTTVPMSWASAPGHVELSKPELAATDDGCVFALPTPTFSYDITSP